MKTRLIYVLVVLAMGITIGVGMWVMLSPRRMEPIKKYVATPLKDDNLTEITETTETSASAKGFTPEERALEAKETFLAPNGVCRC